MPTTELSTYVNSLAAPALTGTEVVYLASDNKTTTQDIANIPSTSVKIWKAQVTQAGTSAPVLTVLVNTLGVTVVPGYTSPGQYTLSGFDSNLTGLVAMEKSNVPTLGEIVFGVSTSSVAVLNTLNTGGATANDILDPTAILSQIITVTKYD